MLYTYKISIIGEIAHRGVEKWSIDLENMISKYVTRKYKKEKPKYKIQHEDVYLVLRYLFSLQFDHTCGEESYQLGINIKKEIERNNVHGRKQKKAPEKQKNSYPIKQIKKEKYDPTLLYNKTVKDIAFMFHISPISLLFMIQRRICSKEMHCVNDINDILDKTKVSLCHRIFEELWSMNNKESK